MTAQKRPILGPIAGFVIVMLLAGMLYAPTALANAESDNGKVKGNTNTNTNSNNNDEKYNGKGNGDGEKDNDNKCKKHKYDGICDTTKPVVKITSTTNHSVTSTAVLGTWS